MKNPAQKYAVLMGQLRKAHCRQHMEALFLYAAAPILGGVKPAVLITLRPDCVPTWEERRNALLRATGLQTIEIQSKQNAVLLLIYDEAALLKALQNTEATMILNEYGYPADRGPSCLLRHLEERFAQSKIPHEIGIFLGYPPKDVETFIENKGRNCVCCRHWKIYYNAEHAREMWERIDAAHSYALEVLSGMPPVHIAANLLKAA